MNAQTSSIYENTNKFRYN